MTTGNGKADSEPPSELEWLRIVVSGPVWGRYVWTVPATVGLHLTARGHLPLKVLGWLLVVASAIVFARSIAYTILELDRRAMTFALYSKGGPTFVRDIDTSLGDCRSLRLDAYGPFEWIELHDREGTRVIWWWLRRRGNRESVRAAQTFLTSVQHPDGRAPDRPTGA